MYSLKAKQLTFNKNLPVEKDISQVIEETNAGSYLYKYYLLIFYDH